MNLIGGEKKQEKITSYSSGATTGIHPRSHLYPICAITVPSHLVPLLMKNTSTKTFH